MIWLLFTILGVQALHLVVDWLNNAEDPDETEDVFERLNCIEDKLTEGFMGLKEDYAALNDKFTGLEATTNTTADAVADVALDISALKAEIAEANERANIDLQPLIARAEGLEAKMVGLGETLRAAAGPVPGSDPAEPPPPPPPIDEPPV